MTSWRQRLCGSQIAKGHNESEESYDLQQVLQSNESLSHGGGLLANKNPANLKTSHSVMLPTENYAVLILNKNGQAVIYSEDENIVEPNEEILEEGPTKFSFVFKDS